MNKADLTRTEALTTEMTNLANERSFLAYIRTVVVLLSSGFAILKLEIFQEFELLGYFLTITAPILLIIGIIRFFQVKKVINMIIKK